LIIKSAFRLLPCYPGDFDLIGFKIGEMYYIDKMYAHEMFDIMLHFWTFFTSFPMVCSGSTWSKILDHYENDFFFAEIADIECSQFKAYKRL
jgi:hypothetical protein